MCDAHVVAIGLRQLGKRLNRRFGGRPRPQVECGISVVSRLRLSALKRAVDPVRCQYDVQGIADRSRADEAPLEVLRRDADSDRSGELEALAAFQRDFRIDDTPAIGKEARGAAIAAKQE